MKNKYTAIDLFKIICAFLVVGIHTYPFLCFGKNVNFYLTLVIGRIAVPFFFIASSFFFFKKINFKLDIKDQRNTDLLKKYLGRLLKMYLIWCAVYLIFNISDWTKTGFSIITLLIYLRDLIFTGGMYHLWFLPAMIISTILVYIFVYKFDLNKTFYVCLGLYIAGMLINVYGSLFSNIPIISTFISIYTTLFDTTRNGIFFAPIFTYIGLRTSKKESTLSEKTLIGNVGLTVIIYILEVTIDRYVLNIEDDLVCMYLTLIPMSYYLFNYLLKLNININISGKFLRNMSTLIYLSHIIFVRILPTIPNSFIDYLFIIFITIIFSMLFIGFSNKIKFLKEFY